jgi:hypothetical protein
MRRVKECQNEWPDNGHPLRNNCRSKMPRPTCGNVTKGWSKSELTLEQRKTIFITCINAELRGGIKKGFFKTLSSKLPVSARTVSVTWAKLRQKYEENVSPLAAVNIDTVMATLPDAFFATNKKITGQNARIWAPETIGMLMVEIPKSKRQTIRSTSSCISVPRSSFQRLMKSEGAAIRHSNALKSILTEENKVARVSYCLDKIQPRTINSRTGPMKYKEDMDIVEIDEKWFNLTKDGVKYYLAPGEAPPTRRTRHKGYIDKVMFLSGTARPRKLIDGTWWDGKLGMWPFGSHKPAERSSCKRPKGTMVWWNENVDAETYRAMLMAELVPSICAHWPDGDFRNQHIKIRIQQDGAGAHIKPDDAIWLEYLEEMGLSKKVILFNQPANSPDLNINDLGLFNAIQAVYNREVPRTYDDIITCVQRAYWEYPREKINRLFLTKMAVMNEIIRCNGDNDYKLPHMNKASLEQQDKLPTTLEVTEHALELL